MKLKQKFEELFNNIKTSIQTFPLTIIAIMVLTAIYAINIGNSFISSKIMSKIFLFVVTFVAGAFLIETLIKEKSRNRTIGYIFFAIIAFIFTCLITQKDGGIFGLTNAVFEFRISRLYYCYLIVMFTLSAYFNYTNSGKSPQKYLTCIFVNTLKVSLIYGIFSIGIAAVLGIFIFLILNGSGYMLIARVEILLLGFYYLPALLYTFYKQEEVGKFGKIVIKYILNSLVMAAFIVIYIYIIKIIVLRDIPSNQIFRILTTLFVLGMPIWTMTMNFDEGKLLDKINKKLPLLFMPFVILQIYAIGVRIAENGITPLRYICVMFIIFEIIYIAIYMKNREKIGNILLVFAAMVAVSSIVPYVNMFYISNVSQYNRFKENYYKGVEYTEEEKDIIYGAYDYLTNNSVEGYKYLTNLTEIEKSNIKEFNADSVTSDTNNYEYLYGKKEVDYINIDDYSMLYKVSEASYKGDMSIEEFSSVSLNVQDANGNVSQITIDMFSLIDLYIKNIEDFSECFKENNEIELTEDRKFILENISLKYNHETCKIDSYSFSGYLLEK